MWRPLPPVLLTLLRVAPQAGRFASGLRQQHIIGDEEVACNKTAKGCLLTATIGPDTSIASEEDVAPTTSWDPHIEEGMWEITDGESDEDDEDDEDAEVEPEDEPKNDEVPSRTVRILFTRHAQSCANVVQKHTKSVTEGIRHTMMKDPVLTNCGISRSRIASTSLRKQQVEVDVVLSSSLMRAIQTAALMYPNVPVTPVPYISERGQGSDNSPRTVSEQRKRLKMDYVTNISAELGCKVDMQWMEHPVFGEARAKPSFMKFLRFMAENFIPSLPQNLRQKRTLVFAVVTHSHFLSQSHLVGTRCGGHYHEKPRNNQVMELSFLYQGLLTVSAPDPATGKRLQILPQKRVDPFSPEGAIRETLINELKKDAANNKLLDSILIPSLPPWKTVERGVSLTMERKLFIYQNEACKSIYSASDEPAYVCEADVGKVCSKAISKLPKLNFFHVRLNTKERQVSKYEGKLIKAYQKATTEGKYDKYEALKQQLKRAQDIICCVSE